MRKMTPEQRERHLARRRRYYANNYEKHLEWKKNYQLRNPEKFKEQRKASFARYCEKNKDKILDLAIKRRAKYFYCKSTILGKRFALCESCISLPENKRPNRRTCKPCEALYRRMRYWLLDEIKRSETNKRDADRKKIKMMASNEYLNKQRARWRKYSRENREKKYDWAYRKAYGDFAEVAKLTNKLFMQIRLIKKQQIQGDL